MQIICTCGCKINYSKVEIKLTEEPGVPCIPIKCPNCNKEILITAIDMGDQSIMVTNKRSKEIELSFKEETK